MAPRAPRRLLLLLAAATAAAGVLLVLFSASSTLAVAPPAPAAADPEAARTNLPESELRLQRQADQVLLACFGAPAGSTFRYHVDDRSEFTVASAEAGTQPAGRLHAACEVVTIVLDRRGDEALVQQQIEGLEFFGDDGRAFTDDPVQAAFVAASAAPVLMRIDGRGKVRGYAFVDGLDGDQRNFLRGTLGLLAFPAPAAANVWKVTTSDTTGDYEARCELQTETDAERVRVRCTRQRYTAMAGHDELPQHELSGSGDGEFSRVLGWLTGVQLDEGMTLQLPMLDLRAVTTRRAHVRLLSADRTVVSGEHAADWARAVAPASGAGERIGRFAADDERRAWQQRLAGVTIDQLLAELQQLLAAGEVDAEALDAAFQRMQWLSRLDPAAIDAIHDRIDTRQLRGDMANVALSSLAAGGTEAGQAVLTAVRADRSLDADLRQAATIASLQLDQPSTALVAGLCHDAADDFEGRGSAMLVLGALAPRHGAPLADGRSAIDTLLAMEAASIARGELSTWLLAIGNAAPPQTVAIVQRHLADADPAVRASACVALRRVTDPIVVTILVERGLSDVDVDVRREAVLVLGERREPAARAALQQVAAADPDLGLRQRADSLLAGG